jgi:hypothetical protein
MSRKAQQNGRSMPELNCFLLENSCPTDVILGSAGYFYFVLPKKFGRVYAQRWIMHTRYSYNAPHPQYLIPSLHRCAIRSYSLTLLLHHLLLLKICDCSYCYLVFVRKLLLKYVKFVAHNLKVSHSCLPCL